MKQLLLLSLMTVAGGLGALYHPFYGVLLYYTLAVLRPQYLWDWALPIDLRWSLMAAAIVFASLLLNSPKILTHLRVNVMSILMMAYALFLLLSCLLAYNPHMAQVWGVECGKILLVAIIATFVIDDLRQVRILTYMILIVLGYIAWEVNINYVLDGRLDIFHLGYGGLDNNGAGLLLAMGLPVAGAIALSAPIWWHRVLAAGFGILLMHAVMMTYSRGAMLSGTIGALWMVLHHKPRRHVVAVLLVVTMLASVMAGKEIRERMVTTIHYQRDASAQSRFESWGAAWDMIWDSPVVGHGIRNSNQFSLNYGADTYGRTIHNMYLQIGADTGLPAMTLYMTMIVVAFVQMRRSRQMVETFHADRTRHQIRDPLADQMPHLVRGLEGSLLTFAFGAVFLSLEVFELSWLLLTLAGILPAITQRYLQGLTQDIEDLDAESADNQEPALEEPALLNPALARRGLLLP